MADILKLLVTTPANRNPSAATNTTVYTVPGSTSAMLSRVMVANRSATPTTFRIAIVESGGSIGNQHYIAFDVPIAGNDSVTVPVGAGLATGDFIVVYATLATLTFTPMGIEIT
jgi:hypothetical protein